MPKLVCQKSRAGDADPGSSIGALAGRWALCFSGNPLTTPCAQNGLTHWPFVYWNVFTIEEKIGTGQFGTRTIWHQDNLAPDNLKPSVKTDNLTP